MTKVSRRSLLKSAGAAGIVGLAGCTGGSGGGTETPTDGDDKDTTETLTIGVPLPFTGPYGFYGEGMLTGIKFAFQQVNNSDETLPNTELEVVSAETETNPEVGLSAARDLVLKEGADHLLGVVSSDVANAVRGFVKGRDQIFLNAGSASDFITQGADCNRNTFRAHNHNGLFGAAGAAWSTEQFGQDVFLIRGDYSYGEVVSSNIKRGVESAGGTVIKEAVKPLGGDEFGGVIGDIMETDPDWISMYMSGSGGIAFFNQAAERGLETTCAGGPPPGFALQGLKQEVLETLPPVYSDAKLWLANIDVPENQEFVDSFKTEHDRPPTAPDEQGYLPGVAMVNILDETGGAGASTDEVIEAARGLTFPTTRGETTIRACDHQGAQPTYPSKVVSVEGDTTEYEIQEKIETKPFRQPCDEIACSHES